MNANEHGLELDDITKTVRASASAVSNALAAGFLEKVCENAFLMRLASEDFELNSRKLSSFSRME